MAIPDHPPDTKDEFEQVVEKLKTANSVLVTISTDPTVDEFAACIGLTLVLNKIGKHANAVFSGKVPSTIKFLKPEKTIEADTDSLRDFIIALDKSKADKLRYKVEDEVVKIFITPYKTSIDEKDLEFSQGDFNVDAIVALGVQDKNHIDQAILAHGRILHDAAVISINISKQSKIGSINWSDARASSLCEMVTDIASELDSKVFDSQNATALLTGIVAETDRYSNDKAAPHTMSVAGLLMSAGASTQLVSKELEQGEKPAGISPVAQQSYDEQGETGVLEIEHPKEEEKPEEELPPPPVEPTESMEPETENTSTDGAESSKPEIGKPKVMHEPPEFSSKLTANSESEDEQESANVDPLNPPTDTPILNKSDSNNLPAIDDDKTLSDIEKAVDSPHLDENSETTTGTTSLDEARDALLQAQTTLNGEDTDRPEARQDLGTTELDSDLNKVDSDMNKNGIPPESATLDTNAKDTPPPPVPPPYLPPNS